MKTYAQNCPVALALDAIGDRWTLLILRELALGDQRFTDLRTALPGIAPNLLSARLAELAERDLVARAELPPPAARSVYRLSGRGEAVRPVLGALARFGIPEMDRAPMRPLAAVLTLLSAWYRPPCALSRAVVEVDGERFALRLGDRVTVRPLAGEAGADGDGDGDGGDGDGAEAEVAMVVDSPSLIAARQDGTPPAATYTGAPEAVAAFRTAFRLP